MQAVQCAIQGRRVSRNCNRTGKEAATIEDELAGRKPQSQIQRIIEQLGTTSIPALSPQAKGRIERLWQTFQDRLRKEMRLAGIASLDQANRFLETFIPAYNQRFAKVPRDPQSACCTRNWIWTASSPPPPSARSKLITPSLFVVSHSRSYRRKNQPCLVACKVTVHVTPENELHLYHHDTKLAHRRLDQVVTAPLAAKRPTPVPPQPPKPPDPHARRRRKCLSLWQLLSLAFFPLSGGFALPLLLTERGLRTSADILTEHTPDIFTEQ